MRLLDRWRYSPRHLDRLNRKQKRHVSDPSFLFSTWPIPEWDGARSVLYVTSGETTPEGSRFVSVDSDDTDRLQACFDRADAASGRIILAGGTFRLTRPLQVGANSEARIVDNLFTYVGPDLGPSGW